MTTKEIIEALREGGNFKFHKNGTVWVGHGGINCFDICKLDETGHPQGITEYDYIHHWYPKKKKILESIPWTKEVKYPRAPVIYNEYPEEDGEYITMLDCDEHAILINTLRNGTWTLYNETHVKWWMPFTKEMEEYAEGN